MTYLHAIYLSGLSESPPPPFFWVVLLFVRVQPSFPVDTILEVDGKDTHSDKEVGFVGE